MGSDQRGLVLVLERLTPVQREIRSDSDEWYLTRINPYRSASDQIQGVVITLVEITQLKNAQFALLNSEEKFRALVTASAETVWTTNANGLMVEQSESWRAFTGQSLEHWRGGAGWADAVHPDDRSAAVDAWRRSITTQTQFDMEFRLRHASGDWRWTHARAVPLRDDAGKTRGWVGMNIDVTDRKTTELAQLEAESTLRESNRRKDDFLALLGHELRNPLTPLRTTMAVFAKLLPPDPELRRMRDISERQVLHLTRLVDDLLDVARINSGRLELRLRRLDLRDAIATAVANVDTEIKGRHHTLTVEQSPEPLDIDGDEVRLVQIFTNLLDNAAKYTPEAGRLRVAARREGLFAVISVFDHGKGFSPQAPNQMFDAFTRIEPAARSGGLGLGLALVRRLVELHGGSVEAHSDGLGKGAEFIVRLPLMKAENEAEGATGDVSDKKLAPTPRRILVVEDNPAIAESMELLLQIEGHEVTLASDGQSALQAAAQFAPEVVLLDIGLPDMDGYELARRLRKLETTSKALLIAATGYGQPGDRIKSAEAGIDHHMVKPVDVDALLAHIANEKRHVVDHYG